MATNDSENLRADLSDLNISHEIDLVSARPSRWGGIGDIHQGVRKSTTGPPTSIAIKFMRSNDKEFGVMLRRHRREIRVWRRIHHVNVLPLLGLYWDDTHPLPAMVSPWCERGSMNDHFKALPPGTDVLHLKHVSLHQIACGLAHCGDTVQHEASITSLTLILVHSYVPPIVHGDLKGVNILVSDEGVARICDFGLSKITAVTTDTVTSIRGTVRWMAPELFDDDACTTTATDVWAYACVIVEIFSGTYPYSAQTDPAVIISVSKGKLPARPDLVSDACWALALKCFARYPKNRPAADEIVGDSLFHEYSVQPFTTFSSASAEEQGSPRSTSDMLGGYESYDSRPSTGSRWLIDMSQPPVDLYGYRPGHSHSQSDSGTQLPRGDGQFSKAFGPLSLAELANPVGLLDDVVAPLSPVTEARKIKEFWKETMVDLYATAQTPDAETPGALKTPHAGARPGYIRSLSLSKSASLPPLRRSSGSNANVHDRHAYDDSTPHASMAQQLGHAYNNAAPPKSLVNPTDLRSYEEAIRSRPPPVLKFDPLAEQPGGFARPFHPMNEFRLCGGGATSDDGGAVSDPQPMRRGSGSAPQAGTSSAAIAHYSADEGSRPALKRLASQPLVPEQSAKRAMHNRLGDIDAADSPSASSTSVTYGDGDDEKDSVRDPDGDDDEPRGRTSQARRCERARYPRRQLQSRAGEPYLPPTRSR